MGFFVRINAAVRRYGFFGSLLRIWALGWRRLHTRIYALFLGISVGKSTIIEPGAFIRRQGGKITIGDGCVIHSGARLLAHGGHIFLDKGTSVNPYTILYGHGGLDIGEGVLIAALCTIIPANHVADSSRPIRGQGLTAKGISIGKDVWIATGVRVLDGASIGDGAVVAAGAVVIEGRLEPMGIYGGVPARKISERRKVLQPSGETKTRSGVE